jgi:RNA polymerase sigma-70 factor (ECF subfamily)
LVLEDSATEELLILAGRGDRVARDRLLAQHRGRLRQMIAVRLDRRLAARIDPSDVVQETLAQAAERLADYIESRPVPFYPWLRKLAFDRLIDLHRRHVRAQKRSVTREEPQMMTLPDESAMELANRLLSRGSSPMAQLLRAEQKGRVQSALLHLPPRDREILILRHLEQLSIAEISAVLEITEGAVKLRQLRALERFRDLLSHEEAE